jgi:hypothetical protein
MSATLIFLLVKPGVHALAPFVLTASDMKGAAA